MVEGEFFFGMPKSAFFRTDKKKAIVIGCSLYDELREIEGKEGFADIPESMDDIMVVEAGLRRLGFKKQDITVLRDPVYQEVAIAMNDMTG